jgi:hypothetical protein
LVEWNEMNRSPDIMCVPTKEANLLTHFFVGCLVVVAVGTLATTHYFQLPWVTLKLTLSSPT